MEGTWGRRVYGSVRKGRRYTRFRLELTLQNGLVIYNVIHVPNQELEEFSDLYAWTLNQMTEELIKRVNERV